MIAKKIFTFTSFTKPLGNQITCKSNQKTNYISKAVFKTIKATLFEKILSFED